MNENSRSGEGTDMDVQQAAAIIEESGERARRALYVRRPVLFGIWGLAFLVCYGACWLSVLGQRPYTGPTPAALLTLTIVVAAAYAATVVLVGRAGMGVGGRSALQRRIMLMAYFCAYVGLFVLEAALDHAGASRAVLGVYGAAAPLLLAGVVAAAASALALDWWLFGLGIWLLVLAAGSGWAGPVNVWAVDALAVSLALLALAAIGFRRSRA